MPGFFPKRREHIKHHQISHASRDRLFILRGDLWPWKKSAKSRILQHPASEYRCYPRHVAKRHGNCESWPLLGHGARNNPWSKLKDLKLRPCPSEYSAPKLTMEHMALQNRKHISNPIGPDLRILGISGLVHPVGLVVA